MSYCNEQDSKGRPPATSDPDITEIMEAARIFARDYHTRKMFEGYTEDEVMKGAAVTSFALRSVQATPPEKRSGKWMSSVLDTLVTAGVMDDETDRIMQVYDIIAEKIPRPSKKSAPPAATDETHTNQEPTPLHTSQYTHPERFCQIWRTE